MREAPALSGFHLISAVEERIEILPTGAHSKTSVHGLIKAPIGRWCHPSAIQTVTASSARVVITSSNYEESVIFVVMWVHEDGLSKHWDRVNTAPTRLVRPASTP